MFNSGSIVLDASIQNLAEELGEDRIPVVEVTLFNIAGNNVVSVGGPAHQSTLSPTVHGFQVVAAAADGPSGVVKIGPFSSNGAPFDMNQIYVLGTNNQRLGVAWVSP